VASFCNAHPFLPIDNVPIIIMVSDKIHEVLPDDLVFLDDFMENQEDFKFLPSLKVKSLSILTNLSVEEVNDFGLDEFLNDLIVLSNSNAFNETVKVYGDVFVGKFLTNINM